MSDDDFDLDEIETYADPDDDEYVRVRKADMTKVRRAARGKSGLSKQEREELEALRTERLVRDADLGGLSARQAAIVAREAGADRSPQALRQIAEELGFVQPAPPSQEEQQNEAEIDAQNEAVATTTGAPPANTRVSVTAEEAAAWPQDKLMRLDRQHPEIYELLLRGEPITVPAGFN